MADEGKSKKTSAADAVFEALRSQISSGVWKVGDRLPSEGELAERYGVNRLTVRVALQKLNALGVVETRAGAGTHVIEFDFENYLRMASKFYGRGDMLQEITEFRNHLEIECARLACERATDEDLAELERLALEHRRVWIDSQDVEHDEWCRRVAAADLEFHEQVVRMSHNRLFIYAFSVAREPVYEYILFSVSKWTPELVRSFRLDKQRDIHYCIYESIKQRDFTTCQSDYAAMIASYARASWTMPVVG